MALLLAIGAVAATRALAVAARRRAETAADLAALAAADRIGLAASDAVICAAAGDIARRNGAALRSCAVTLAPDGRSGAVRVEVTAAFELPVVDRVTVRASARAGRLPAQQ